MNMIVSAAAISSASAAPVAATPDAELIELGHRYDELIAQLHANEEQDEPYSTAFWVAINEKEEEYKRSGLPPHIPNDVWMAISERTRKEHPEPRPTEMEIWAQIDEVTPRILAMTATTIAGLAAKARVARFGCSSYWDADEANCDWDKKVARKLMDAVLSHPEAGASTVVGIARSKQIDRPADPDPIFAALDAYRQADAAVGAALAVDDADEPPKEVEDQYCEAKAALLHTRPTTPAGLAAMTGWAREIAKDASTWWSEELCALHATIDDATRGMAGLEPWSPPAVESAPSEAELVAFAERCVVAEREYHAACDARSEAEEIMAYGDRKRRRPRPQVLRVRRSDADLGIPATARRGESWYDRDFTIACLRDERWWKGEFETIRTDDYHGSIERCFTPTAAARARADEIIAAYDAWKPEKHKPSKAQIRAFKEAEQKADVATDRASEMQDKLAAMPATTLAGAVAKVRVLKAMWPNTPLRPGEGALESELMASVANDLLRLAPGGSAA